MSAAITLAQMTDLALGTPEVGAVNFTVLHSLLHAIIQNVGIANVKTSINEADKNYLANQKDYEEEEESESLDTEEGVVKKISKGPYIHLEKKVSKLEKKLKALNELPSTKELYEKTTNSTASPVNEMWQSMQLKNKVEAHDTGIDKCMTMIQDLMNELGELKDNNEDQSQGISAPKTATPPFSPRAKVSTSPVVQEEVMSKLRELESKTSDVTKKLSMIPSAAEVKDFVTWHALEEQLEIVKENLQEEIIKSNAVIDTISRASLTTEVQNKPDRQEVLSNPGGLPPELWSQMRDVQDQVQKVQRMAGQDNEALGRVSHIVAGIQGEINRLNNCTQRLMDENERKQQEFEGLLDSCKKLEDVKADKDYVLNEIDVKADKKVLDLKVNKTLFDSTYEELNRMVNDILGKISGHEVEWREATAQLNKDLDGKLDRLEFGPIKDELNRQLKSLLKKLKAMRLQQHMQLEDEAAGLRKQLLQRFHCISCDRPVEMMQHGPNASLPVGNALPATKTTRPYTTYELDKIRQDKQNMLTGKYDHPYNMSNPQQHQQVEVVDLYGSDRPCGGSYTLTQPHKRMARVTHQNNLFKEEDLTPSYRDELDIQGADGHIYKGRNEGKLPKLSQNRQLSPHQRVTPSVEVPPRRSQTSMARLMNNTEPLPATKPGSPRRSSSGRIPRVPSRAASDKGSNTQLPPAPAAEVPSIPDPPAQSFVSMEDSAAVPAPPARTPSPNTPPPISAEHFRTPSPTSPANDPQPSPEFLPSEEVVEAPIDTSLPQLTSLPQMEDVPPPEDDAPPETAED